MQKLIIALSLVFIANYTLVAQSKIEHRDADHREKSQFSQVIKKGKANKVKLLMNISGGEVNLRKSISNLAKVDFDYYKKDWNPSVSYTEDNTGGKLQVKALTKGEEKRINNHNYCAILVNPEIEYSLGIVVGAGVANLNFADFDLDKALFKLGVGSFNINLSNTSIPLLKVEAGIGEATIDLSGKWKNNLNANIKAGIGELKIIVPKEEGVQFTISGFLGDIETPDYHKADKVYTNKNYNKAPHKLNFTIVGAIGSITIIER